MLVSCKHERNNEQKLQNEIIRLQKIIEKQDWQHAKFEDSILKGNFFYGCRFYRFYAINKPESNHIIDSDKYKTKILFIENQTSYIDTLLYTNALSSKIENPKFINSTTYNQDDENCFNVELKPIKIGWNYFYAKIIHVNHRTKEVMIYPFIDSFYVYK